ncbi:Homocysteine S-methyltransferase [Backusella circina FSU 941]|nr:Homocysteine S-methyltransferase [Backusella circina FSU 941]
MEKSTFLLFLTLSLSLSLFASYCRKYDFYGKTSVHKLYYEAGANIVTTFSYQASLEGFLKEGYTKEQAIDTMNKSVSLAFDARDEFKQSHPEDTLQRLIALSIGCYGAILANGAEYHGDYGDATLEKLVDFHKSRLEIFLEGHSGRNALDMIIFETVPSYIEAKAIRQLLLDWKADPSKNLPELPPIAVSFQCKSSTEIADGHLLQDALSILEDLDQVFSLGFNCTKRKFIDTLLSTTAQENKKNNKAIIIYPDGGDEWDAVTRSWNTKNRLVEDAFAKVLREAVMEYGPKIIVGGCCGTGPSHIKAVRSFLEQKGILV